VVAGVFTAVLVEEEAFTEVVAEPTSPVEGEDITAPQAHDLTVAAVIVVGCPLRRTGAALRTADRMERLADLTADRTQGIRVGTAQRGQIGLAEPGP
jgi:hypothetical protein